MEKYIWCLIVVSFHSSKLQNLSEVSETQQEAVMTKVTVNQLQNKFFVVFRELVVKLNDWVKCHKK